jgi:L-alanine-DL-glutamate epimerase-like enolase superfamily enzyme
VTPARALGARLVALRAEPLSVPLREPFVIATARMEATRAALVRATLELPGGERAEGLGEAAALPPVTREDQPDLLDAIARASAALIGTAPGDAAALDAALADRPVARAGVETAILDALARLAGVPLAALLAGVSALAVPVMETDVTLPIAAPEHMARTAIAWRDAGFACSKVKVGRAWADDRDALRAVHAAVPEARFRLDANEGFSARDALALLDDALCAGLVVECFEQPCRREDLAGMAAVCAGSSVPVVADESLRTDADLDAILRARAARGVNLKLVKHGGPRAALALGRRAKAEGLGVMAGAMVETRLGLTAMAHVVTALGGVDWLDLDTALLLASDPFDGGIRTDGSRVTLAPGPGLDIAVRPS